MKIAAAVEFFEKNVRPVLVEQCLPCHDANKAKGELRLDTREGLLKGGQGVWGPVPMPPNATVSDADIKTLVTYILALK